MSETAAAAAVGARTARACDSCLRKRARWYCAADDAFLCQSCDHLVHSANQLARRHERVMLKSMSLPAKIPISDDTTVPSWHQAVRRKARSPRFHNKTKKLGEVMKGRKRTWPVVPDLEATGTDESGCADDEEEDVKLIHRVPVLDRSMSSESHRSSPSMFSEEGCGGSGEGVLFPASGKAVEENDEGLPSPLGFIPSNMDMEEFAMDVESLLGQGLDHESFSMDDLGLSESRDCGVEHHFFGEKDGGVKEEGLRRLAKVEITDQIGMEYQMPPQPPKMTISLKLNYKAIVDAWSSSSPWVDGERPRFNPNDCLPDNMAEMMLSGREDQIYLPRPPSVLDIGREAKVMRYKEKRRTRLFSKKIRYEVRKLNAEKRPRMKGRFVKRTCLSIPTAGATAVF